MEQTFEIIRKKDNFTKLNSISLHTHQKKQQTHPMEIANDYIRMILIAFPWKK